MTDSYFVITIDVEPDCSPSWRYSDPLTFHGVSVGIGERLQPLFRRHGVCPTYLVNNVVLEHPPSVAVLRSLEGACELGSHLHGEFIDPGRLHADPAGKKGVMNQCSLPPEVEAGKMEALTALFRKTIGRSPTAFRAGRFSAGRNTMGVLRDLGYLVDTSVTPHVCWDDPSRERSVDYREAPEQPYFVGPGSYPAEESAGVVLEVPVSIDFRWKRFRRREIWARPVYSSAREIRSVIDAFHRRHGPAGVVYNMMFHNVEVLPGLSPNTQTEDECLRYMESVETFITECQARGALSIGLSGLHDVYAHRRREVKVS